MSGYFLWASIGAFEHWPDRGSLVLAATVVLALAIWLAYRRAMRSAEEVEKVSDDDADDRPG